MTNRQLFLQHLAQTTPFPLSLEIEKAEGVYLYGPQGERYLDLISGIGVSNVGHCHPYVVEAIRAQAGTYMHLMVYGELVQRPQIQLAKALSDLLPERLDSVYLVNSGAEAIEGAMKLAKRATGRTEIISFKNAYHGSTQGALSIMGSEEYKNAYRPLLPDTRLLEHNNFDELENITSRTAAVIIETIQGEAGVRVPQQGFLKALKSKCEKEGALLVIDEIQTAIGRTGTHFAFEQFEVVPDILCLAKGLGAGMPIGAFIANKQLMQGLSHTPILGHITTFGGHPVSCAAALAGIKALKEENLTAQVLHKERLFLENLNHPAIKEIRSRGLMMAVQLDTMDNVLKVCAKCLEKGVFTDWFLFCSDALRIAPPLIITEEQILWACKVIVESLKEVYDSKSI